MPSKAFPLPIGIGIDLIQTSRIETILKDHYKLNRWAQRIFTRPEWPFISHKCQQHASRLGDTHKNNFRPGLILPKIWQNADIKADAAETEALPPLTCQLLRLLAGRWAMKEAVIKAHRNRKLYMNEISVIKAERDSDGSKPQVLIDPPSQTIMMDARVASLRGLREAKYENMERNCLLQTKSSVRNSVDQQLLNLRDYPGVIYKRRALVKEEDRQMAEGNISHDSEYAVAICMAFDEKFKSSDENIDPIFDDGSGKPLHEPAWGDEGFLE
ncbi:hypothetical protein MMC31_000708 [Peltigera leucophlebia]|nr:hypothetical protein [Peltigera leucophlebia]